MSGYQPKIFPKWEIVTKVDSDLGVLCGKTSRRNVTLGTSHKGRARTRMTSSRRSALLFALLAAAGLVMQQKVGVAVAQENGSDVVAGDVLGARATGNLGAMDGALSLGLTGGRRPFYRLQKSDTVDVNFPFAQEFNQTLTVQPDGFISLKGAENVLAAGRTLTELAAAINQSYARILREPEVTVTLKDFEQPYFIVSGEVTRPGKYQLRSETTVIEAVGIAGGFTSQARHSEVVLFRGLAGDATEARRLNLKKLLNTKSFAEDTRLHPGDLVFVPQNTISKVRKYLPLPTTGVYVNPMQY